MSLDPDEWRAVYAEHIEAFRAGRIGEWTLRHHLTRLGFRPGAQLEAEVALQKKEASCAPISKTS